MGGGQIEPGHRRKDIGRQLETEVVTVFFSVCVFKDYYLKSIRVVAFAVVGKVINMNFWGMIRYLK